MLQASYKIDNEPELFEVLEVEEKDLQTPRASVSITQENDTIIISLNAKDYTAFRALNSAIERLLTTYYKIKGL